MGRDRVSEERESRGKMKERKKEREERRAKATNIQRVRWRGSTGRARK